MARDFREHGVPLIRLAGVKAGADILAGCNYLDPEMVERKWSHFRVIEDDVILSTSATLGEVARVPLRGVGAIPYTGLIRMRGKAGIVDQDFLQWILKSPNFAAQVRAMGVGSVMNHFGPSHLKQMTLTLPSLDEQRRIAGVLGALDDLIEVNRRLVAELDETVRLLGASLVSDLADRSIIPLTEVGDVSKGYSYKSSELVAGGGWLVNLKNVGRSGTFEARGFKPLTATVKPHQVIDNGTIVVAQTDLTQDREVIARPVRVRRGNVQGQLTASLDLVIVRPKDFHTEESIFALLDTEDFRNHALGYCNGTTVLHMGAKALPDYSVPQMTQQEVEGFTARVRPLREAADALTIETAELEATRDELLPLLMSGRVRVSEAVAA